jgi:hypothetical protein
MNLARRIANLEHVPDQILPKGRRPQPSLGIGLRSGWFWTRMLEAGRIALPCPQAMLPIMCDIGPLEPGLHHHRNRKHIVSVDRFRMEMHSTRCRLFPAIQHYQRRSVVAVQRNGGSGRPKRNSVDRPFLR